MKVLRAALLILALTLTLVTPSTAAPGPKPKPLKVRIFEPDEVFCPSAILVFGNVIIQSERCYTLFILRNVSGTFLAFGPPEPAFIPPGQLVRLTTPAGAKVKGRIFYLVPIQTAAVLVPVNTITAVAVRVEDFGPRLGIILLNTPVPNVTVIFTVRL